MDMSQGTKVRTLRERIEQAAREKAEREARTQSQAPLVRAWGGGWTRDGQ